MKRVIELCGRLSRLSLMALALLVTQQAFAVGTDAGTSIDNQAQVDYDVGGISQEPILCGFISGRLGHAFDPPLFFVEIVKRL